MAQEQADGSIVVDTELDTKGFAAGSRELQTAIKSLNTKMEALGPTMKKAASGSTSALATFNGKAEALEQTIEKLEAKLKALGDARLPTEDYAWLQKALEGARKSLETLEDRQNKLSATGVSRNTRTWKNLQYDIDNAKQKVETYKNEMAQMENTGEAFQMGSDTEQYAQLSAALENAKQSLAGMKNEAKSAAGSSSTLRNVLKELSSAAASVAKKGASAAASIAKICAKGAVSGIKKLASSMLGLFKSTNKTSGGFSSGLKTMLKYTLSIRSLYMLVRKLKEALIEGYQNLAQYDSNVNSSISSVMSALTQLKNSFAAAFAPILNYVAPILTSLINMLSTATSYIGQFFAALTGSDTYTKATKVQEDYAASLSSTASATDDVSDATESAKRQLASFDELNVLSDSSSNSSNIDTNSGSSGTDPSEMFEQAPVTSAIADYAAAIKSAFKNGNFEEVGTIIASGLNAGVAKVDDWINNTLRPAGVKWAANIALILNGLVSGLDWSLMGKTIADGLNTVLAIANTFLTTFDFAALGTSLSTGLNSIVSNVDWNLLGETIGNYMSAALALLSSAILGFDWAALGTSLSTGLNSIVSSVDWNLFGETIGNYMSAALILLSSAVLGFDWAALGTGLADGINSLVTRLKETLDSIDWAGMAETFTQGVNNLVNGVDWSSVGTLIGTGFNAALTILNTTLTTFDWAGAGSGLASGINGIVSTVNWGGIGTTLSAGITGALTFIRTAITNTDWKGIGTGFSECVNGIDFYGIVYDALMTLASLPTALFDLISGVLQGIDWEKLITDIGTAIRDFLVDFDWAGLFESAGELIGSAFKALFDVATVIADAISDAVTKAKEYFQDKIEECGGNVVLGILKGIKDAIVGIFTWIKDNIFKPIWDGIKKAFGISSPSTVMAEIGGYIVDGLLNGITNLASDIIAIPGKIKDWVCQKFSDAKNWLKEKGSNIISGVKEGMEGAKNLVQNVAGKIKGWVTDKVSSVTSWLKDKGKSVISGMQSGMEGAKSLVQGVAGKIKGWVTDKVSSVTSWLKDKGKDVISGMKGGMENNKSLLSSAATNVKSWVTEKLSNWSEAGTWGSDLCSNLANGISGAVSWVSNAVSGVAENIKSFLGFSEPEKGPLSDFHTYMPDMVDLMTKGINSSKAKAISAVSDMASAISSEIQNGDYSLGEVNTGIDTTLTSFSDKVQDSFTTLIDKLQAIAEKVTFAAPDVAVYGAVPYNTAASGDTRDVSGAIEASNEELGSVFIQSMTNMTAAIVNAIQRYGGTSSGTDVNNLTSKIVDEINRRTRMTGKSQII